MSPLESLWFLDALGVPSVKVKKTYCSLSTLDLQLFRLSRPNGKGYRGHAKEKPLLEALEELTRDHPLIRERSFIADWYGKLECLTARNILEKMGTVIRKARPRYRKEVDRWKRPRGNFRLEPIEDSEKWYEKKSTGRPRKGTKPPGSVPL